MSHFTVLIIGENPEAQLLPFKESPAENGSDGFPSNILEFRDDEPEYLKQFNKDKTKVWYAERSCDITKAQYDLLKRSKMGEEVALKIEESFAFLYKDKKNALHYWEKTKNGKQKRHEVYVEVVDEQRIMREPRGTGSYLYATVKKIKAPESISFKDKYKNFENFMKEYCGYDARDPKTKKFGYWKNPQAKWDWYQLGGRWTGFFRMKAAQSAYAVGKPGLMTEPAEAGCADQARKCDINFEAMVEEAGTKAAERFDKLLRLLDVTELPKIISWAEFIDDKGKYKKWSIDKRRDTYHAQPIKQKIDAIAKGLEDADDRSWLAWLDYEDFMVGREEYIRIQKLQAFSTFAILKDGKWYEKGEMGWWGMVGNEKDTEAWLEEFNKLIDGLPDSTLLSVYDCHI